LYLFDEHRGIVAHEALGSGVDLNMPERYTAIHPHYLDASRPHRSYGVGIPGWSPPDKERTPLEQWDCWMR
jgi:hypothetical protein